MEREAGGGRSMINDRAEPSCWLFVAGVWFESGPDWVWEGEIMPDYCTLFLV